MQPCVSYRALMTATLSILTAGYVGERTASTVSLLRDGEVLVVVDPGMVADRKLILGPLSEAGVAPEQVTDVVFSHHHPDHTLNAALFPAARFHDHWAIYQDDLWIDRPADGFQLSPRSGSPPPPDTPPRTSAPSPTPLRASSCSPTCGGANRARRTTPTRQTPTPYTPPASRFSPSPPP